MLAVLEGIVYSIFDEKIGPIALCWVPPTLGKKLMDDISLRVMNLSFDTEDVPKSVAIIPIPSTGKKTVVKYILYTDASRRGGVGESTLSVVFDEKNDVIFYRYVKDIELLMDQYSVKFIKAHETRQEHVTIQNLVAFFEHDLEKLLNDLKQSEISAELYGEYSEGGSEAFPEEDPNHLKQLKYKIIVVGDPEVGKTSIVLRYTMQAFRRTYIPTIGVNISEKYVSLNTYEVKFVIWDIAGQSKFLGIRKHFYEGAEGVILVFDLTRPETFRNIRNWYQDIKKNFQTPINAVLLANKNDLLEQHQITDEDAISLAKELDIKFFKTSAKTGENVGEVFNYFGEIIVKRVTSGTNDFESA